MFIFCMFKFNKKTYEAKFRYTYKDEVDFYESIKFIKDGPLPDEELLDRALFLLLLVLGTSYYKCFPGSEVVFYPIPINPAQAKFLNTVYSKGLSQYAYENNLSRKKLPNFSKYAGLESEFAPAFEHLYERVHDDGNFELRTPAPLVLQSGGKDSLLTAATLNSKEQPWTALYISSDFGSYPKILEELGADDLYVLRRKIDKKNLRRAAKLGYTANGHVPVTYINMAIATVQAVLSGRPEVITSIGEEGTEPNTHLKDGFPVNHQWSKTAEAEKLFQDYVKTYILPSLKVHSLLRDKSELQIAKEFAEKCWDDFGHDFSSCNVANYKQGHDPETLHWCGKCPKCANSYLLFAPFVPPEEQDGLFPGGKSLFEDPELVETFKGLLGVDGVMKPLECVATVDELRYAYHHKLPGYPDLPFKVPGSKSKVQI